MLTDHSFSIGGPLELLINFGLVKNELHYMTNKLFSFITIKFLLEYLSKMERKTEKMVYPY
jgi:hypothetical protein